MSFIATFKSTYTRRFNRAIKGQGNRRRAPVTETVQFEEPVSSEAAARERAMALGWQLVKVEKAGGAQ